MPKLCGIVIAVVVPFMLGSALLTSRVDTASYSDDSIRPASKNSAARDDADDLSDVLGNPVSDAVARYGIDSNGSLYELHSPQTALPRLPAPKS